MELLISFTITILVVVYIWYIVLISRRNKALEALSSIDVQLRKRHDLIPNIVKLAQKFMTHERGLFEEITKLRSAAGTDYKRDDPGQVQDHLNIEGKLQAALGKLMVQVENYPDLKSDRAMLEAQQTFTEVEGHIAAARRSYNASVTALNNSVYIFPGNVISRMANVASMPFFKIEDEAVKQPVDVNDIMN